MTEKQILFATDFDTAAQAARHEVASVAKAFNARIRVLTALPSALRTWVSSGQLQQEAEDRIANWVRELEAEGVPAEAVPVARGNAGEAIAEAAEQFDINLIMVGASNKGTLERLVVGSTAEAVARHARQPVWVSRPRKDEIQRVAVGVDGSDTSRVAIEDGRAISERCGASLTLVAAIENPDLNPLGMSVEEEKAENDRFRAESEDQIRQFVAAVAPDHEEAVQFAWGDPTSVLTEFARDTQADVLVVGRCGEGGVRRVLLGRTAEGIVRTCPCSLVITGAPQSAAD